MRLTLIAAVPKRFLGFFAQKNPLKHIKFLHHFAEPRRVGLALPTNRAGSLSSSRANCIS